MKFIMKPAPNYRTKDKTERIMFDLTIGLLIILAFGLFNASRNSMNNVINILVLLIVALLVACGTEIIYAKIMKQNPLEYISRSFPWVPAIILVLIAPANITPYAIAISTFIAIVFGKLLFGGFGQNIFNPAGVGRAVIAVSFVSSVTADVIVGATPTASMASLGWLTNKEGFASFISEFGGLSNLFIGLYDGAIGETSSLLIILVGIFLVIRNVIDFRVPVFYIGTIFLGGFLIGLPHNVGLEYGLFHIFTGGALFAAVFMLTDPVTNPTTKTGKIIFAIGAAVITLIIRIKGNLPEGVVFSILLMNMMTPVIDRNLEGQQFTRIIKNTIAILVCFVLGIGIIYFSGRTLEVKDNLEKVKITSVDGNIYTVSSLGFEGDNIIEIEYDGISVLSVKVVEFNDTKGIGDLAINDEYLTYLTTVDYKSNLDIDTVSGATVTSKSIIEAIKLVVKGE